MRGLASSSRKSGTVRKALAMCLVAGVSLLNVTVAGAEDIHVIATGALQGAMKAIKPAYERKTGNRLLIVYGPSFGASPESIPERLKAGEPMDVTVVSEDALKSLMTDGRFDPASKRVVAISRIGVAVPAGKARGHFNRGCLSGGTVGRTACRIFAGRKRRLHQRHSSGSAGDCRASQIEGCGRGGQGTGR